jgi:hypothetical protein
MKDFIIGVELYWWKKFIGYCEGLKPRLSNVCGGPIGANGCFLYD